MESLLEPNQKQSKYVQWLYKIVEPRDVKQYNKLNKSKGFKYGYNEELDIVVISKDGTVGEIYEIQGLQIGIPAKPDTIYSRSDVKEDQCWVQIDTPKFIRDTKSYYGFSNDNSESVKNQWYPYIDKEFDRREDGFWFMNNGEPTYLTGSHYMYLQWTKTDAEIVEYRKANQLFHFFWEACKADDRCYGMCYLKNRRSGFSFMASSETVNQATLTKDSKYGMLSKRGPDAQKMFTDKVVPIALNYPFFFKPIQDGQEKPKSEISFRRPSKRLTANSLKSMGKDEGLGDGLNTIIDWEKTGDYSYDGQKLKLLVHDESGKWEKPANVETNWRITKTCLRLGRRIIGKCMMGSTAGALDSGGEEFKHIYDKSNLNEVKRNQNGQTPSGLYALFVPMEWGYEGYIDKYGYPIFDDPDEPIEDVWGSKLTRGVLSHWRNEVEGLKSSPDDLNEHYRQFPMTENHAFRDEAHSSLFNLIRIQDQMDYNDELIRDGLVTRGDFGWDKGIKDTKVLWHPNKDGKFYITRLLHPSLTNNIKVDRGGLKCPGNEHIGAFGCDSYDISGTVGGGASNGALHGLSKTHMEEFPSNQFFLEYVTRPPTAEIFFEDVLMAIVYYGMPILIENNKPGLLKHIAARGYRGFSMNRPDKKYSKLSVSERELGGVPNSGPQMIHDHANAINSYIEGYVGELDDHIGQMYFNRTLKDWARFDITNRTSHDESISSGLAIMANQRLLYKPRVARDRQSQVKMNLGQRGPNGKLIYSKYGNRNT